MRSSRLALLCGCLIWASALPARAQTDDDVAREHFRAGRAYFERAQYGDAAREFEESYALSQRPALLLNLSRAYELDGRLPEAIDAIDRWLATEDAEVDEAARAGAEGRRGRLVAELEREQREREAEASREPPMPPLRVAGLATLGGSGALLVGAVVTGVLALKKHDELEAACPGGVCPPDRADDVQRGERLANTSTALSVAAGAAAISGALLYLLGGRETADAGPHVELTAGPGEIRGGVRVAF